MPRRKQLYNLPVDLRSKARSYTDFALEVLVGVARSRKCAPAARVTAAGMILDRGWGKPDQSVTGHDGGQLKIIVRHLIDNPDVSSGGPAMIDVTPNQLEDDSEDGTEG